MNEIAEAVGGERVYLDARPGEMRETLADITKVRQKLTWKPKRDILEWIRVQP